MDDAPISPEAQEQFEAAGEDGVAAADVAQATSPQQAKDEVTEQGDKKGVHPSGVLRSIDPRIATKAAALGGQSDGMGIWFPLMLGASLIWAIATMTLAPSPRSRPRVSHPRLAEEIAMAGDGGSSDHGDASTRRGSFAGPGRRHGGGARAAARRMPAGRRRA